MKEISLFIYRTDLTIARSSYLYRTFIARFHIFNTKDKYVVQTAITLL